MAVGNPISYSLRGINHGQWAEAENRSHDYRGCQLALLVCRAAADRRSDPGSDRPRPATFACAEPRWVGCDPLSSGLRPAALVVVPAVVQTILRKGDDMSDAFGDRSVAVRAHIRLAVVRTGLNDPALTGNSPRAPQSFFYVFYVIGGLVAASTTARWRIITSSTAPRCQCDKRPWSG